MVVTAILNPSFSRSHFLSHLSWTPSMHMVHRHTYRQNPYVHKIHLQIFQNKVCQLSFFNKSSFPPEQLQVFLEDPKEQLSQPQGYSDFHPHQFRQPRICQSQESYFFPCSSCTSETLCSIHWARDVICLLLGLKNYVSFFKKCFHFRIVLEQQKSGRGLTNHSRLPSSADVKI